MKNIFFVIAIFLSVQSLAQKNLISNGGFEFDLQDWNGDAAVLSLYDKKEGNNAALISQFTGAEWKGIDQLISIPKNTYALSFSVWIKTNNIQGGKEAYNAGVMTVEILGAGNAHISYENVAQVQGSSSWTKYKKIVLLPKEAKKFRVMLALAQTSGIIMFDEVKAETLSEDDYLKEMQTEAFEKRKAAMEEAAKPKSLVNGNFENELVGWNGVAKVTADAKEAVSAVGISSTEEKWTGIDQMADVPADAKFIQISGWLKANEIKQGKESWNNGVFIVEFTNKEGKNKTGSDELVGSLTGNTDWTYFEKKISIPQGTAKYRLMLSLSNCVGTLLADDVQVHFLNQ